MKRYEFKTNMYTGVLEVDACKLHTALYKLGIIIEGHKPFNKDYRELLISLNRVWRLKK